MIQKSDNPSLIPRESIKTKRKLPFIDNLIDRIKNKIISSSLVHPNTYAKLRGVQFGHSCSFRTKYFGSEPYLISMGNNVATSVDVSFVTHDGAIEVIRNLSPEYKNADLFGRIQIGNNVFIGWGSVILPGTTVGDNVIIGAGSVVKGTLESNSVYAGVPAKFISSIEDYIEKNKTALTFTKHMLPLEKKDFLMHGNRTSQ